MHTCRTSLFCLRRGWRLCVPIHYISVCVYQVYAHLANELVLVVAEAGDSVHGLLVYRRGVRKQFCQMPLRVGCRVLPLPAPLCVCVCVGCVSWCACALRFSLSPSGSPNAERLTTHRICSHLLAFAHYAHNTLVSAPHLLMQHTHTTRLSLHCYALHLPTVARVCVCVCARARPYVSVCFRMCPCVSVSVRMCPYVPHSISTGSSGK